MSDIRVERLGQQHRQLVRECRNQVPEMQLYLRRFALRHDTRDFLARTFVAVDRADEMPRIAGYYSLTTVSVTRDQTREVESLDRLPGFPIPGIFLARLAVDLRAQGHGLGTFLFESALVRALRLAADGPVAFRILVTDAIGPKAAEFYSKLGMTPISDGYPRRMLLDLKPLLAG